MTPCDWEVYKHIMLIAEVSVHVDRACFQGGAEATNLCEKVEQEVEKTEHLQLQ